MMKKLITLICLLPFLICAGASIAQAQHEAKPLGSTNAPYGYYEYLPGDYQESGTKKPLLIFLSGAGERGNGTSELSRAITFGPGREIEKGRDFSFIVLSPQTSGDWHPNELNAFIRYATENYNVDKERIYLTGLSLGAMGILRYVAKFPNKIAALLPISGSGDTDEVCNYSHVPLWAFHGDADDVVPVSGSVAVVNAYNECRPAPSPEAKLTIYPGVGHYAWNQTYDGSAGHDIYAWMLQYSLKGKAGTNQAPVADAGPDKTITLPNNKLSLNGSGTDADGSIASYEWSKLSGPFARLEGRESPDLKLSGLKEGTYKFRLNVKDNEGAGAYDEVRVIVRSDPDENKVPVVNAGRDKRLNLPLEEVRLEGEAKDEDGRIVAYQWKQLRGPDGLETSGEKSVTLRLRNLKKGNYVFELAAEDDKGAMARDEIRLFVKAAPEAKEPGEPSVTAMAGRDRQISLPLESLVLSGFARLENASIASYEWSKVSGPAVKMWKSNTANLVLTELRVGEYRFRFTATTSNGLSDSDEIVLKVIAGGEVLEPENPEKTTQGLTYYYYAFAEGKLWSRMPDLSGLSPDKTGQVETFSLSPREQDNYFAFAYEGFIRIKEAGEYTFYTLSDDGSNLMINDRLVVNNDGNHPARVRYGKIELSPGYHKIRLEYFENASRERLYVSFKGPGVELQEIPRSLLSTKPGNETESMRVALNRENSRLWKDEPRQDLLLYPNPASRELQLQLGSLADEPVTISVLDVAGRILYRHSFGSQKSGSTLQLDLQAYGLQQGSYLLLIENEKQERLGVLRFSKQ